MACASARARPAPSPAPPATAAAATEPAVTDASVILGYLDPAYFAGGELALQPELAHRALESCIARPLGMTVEQAAAGIHRIANAHMADGIRLVSLNRGLDPRDFTLVALGGAGGIHGAALAEELGIRTVLVPRSPGVLSAAGLLSAVIEHEVSGPFHHRFDDTTAAGISEALAALHEGAAALMERESVAGLELGAGRLCRRRLPRPEPYDRGALRAGRREPDCRGLSSLRGGAPAH